MPVINTRSLKLKVGTTFFESEVSRVEWIADGAAVGFTSFGLAAVNGARDHKLSMTIRQNTDATSLWNYVLVSPGITVPVEIWPNGVNTTAPTVPTLVYPKFSSSVIITEPDGTILGGEANSSASEVFTVDVEWFFTARPIMTTS